MSRRKSLLSVFPAAIPARLRLPVGAAIRKTFAQGYDRASLRADVLAGVVVGIVALPLSMALAIAVGVPPQHGLYTAIIAGSVVALTGGSKSKRTSRSRRALSDRAMSRKARQATVMSHPCGSAGGCCSHTDSARISASCTASSAVARSAPRRTRTLKARGTSWRSSTSSTSQ